VKIQWATKNIANYLSILIIALFFALTVANCGKVTEPNSNSWQTLSPMPTARASATAGKFSIDGREKIYVIGGTDTVGGSVNLTTVEIYDLSSNSWSTGEPLPVLLHAMDSAVISNVVYVFGFQFDGYSPSLEVYYPATNTWEVIDWPTSRPFGQGIVALNDRLYFIGGTEDMSTPVGSVEVYYPLTRTWESLPSMPTPRMVPSLAVVGTNIYAVGGKITNSPDTYCQSLEVFNTLTNTWTSLNSFNYYHYEEIEVVSVGTKIYLFGGITPDFRPILTVEAYDTSVGLSSSWEISAIPQVNWAAAMTVKNNTIYSFGGVIISGPGIGSIDNSSKYFTVR
jgi:hypothetical protein